MTEREIITEIERYLSDKSYNYAVMIDGDWGCGKTYFVKRGLSEAIESQADEKKKHKNPKYISLYGCKTVSEIQDAVVFALGEEITNWKKSPENNGSKTGVGKRLLVSTWKIAKAVRDIQAPGTNLYELVGNWFDLDSFVFIFDDIERCDCPLNEVFGFINGLVEHEGVKVILVANEKEIRFKDAVDKKELQYLVALNERIVYPKKETTSSREREVVPLSSEELERRRQIIFPLELIDEEFRRVREKLIGITLRFQPNVKNICKNLILDSFLEKAVKEKLLSKIDSFFARMEAAGNFNLRTFQFFLSKANNLACIVSQLDIPELYRDIITDRIIDDCFDCSLEFKANLQPPEDHWGKILFGIKRENRIKSVINYIEKGELCLSAFQEDISNYIDLNYVNKIPTDDPYTLLDREYYLHRQGWCEEKIAETLSRLSENKYPMAAYRVILKTMAYLVEIGFNEDYLAQAKQYMLKNISVSELPQRIDPDLYFMDGNPQLKEKVAKIVEELNTAISLKNNHGKKQSITEILASENWVNGLQKYIDDNDFRNSIDGSVFCRAEAHKWVDTMQKSEPQELYQFRQWLDYYYPRNVIRNYEKEDIPCMEEIERSLLPDSSQDLIIQQFMIWIKEDLKRIIAFYRSINHE